MLKPPIIDDLMMVQSTELLMDNDGEEALVN